MNIKTSIAAVAATAIMSLNSFAGVVDSQVSTLSQESIKATTKKFKKVIGSGVSSYENIKYIDTFISGLETKANEGLFNVVMPSIRASSDVWLKDDPTLTEALLLRLNQSIEWRLQMYTDAKNVLKNKIDNSYIKRLDKVIVDVSEVREELQFFVKRAQKHKEALTIIENVKKAYPVENYWIPNIDAEKKTTLVLFGDEKVDTVGLYQSMKSGLQLSLHFDNITVA